MKNYAILLRGINVGGKNKVSMATLRECLSKVGFPYVSTYIASGNVIVRSDKNPQAIKVLVEKALIDNFQLDSAQIKVLVLSHEQLRSIVEQRPKGFGEHADMYHSDAIFLIDIPVSQALSVFDPREGVDTIWQGEGVIYSQRVSALRTKSRLAKIIGTPAYQSMTIRSWNTTVALLKLLDALQ